MLLGMRRGTDLASKGLSGKVSCFSVNWAESLGEEDNWASLGEEDNWASLGEEDNWASLGEEDNWASLREEDSWASLGEEDNLASSGDEEDNIDFASPATSPGTSFIVAMIAVVE